MSNENDIINEFLNSGKADIGDYDYNKQLSDAEQSAENLAAEYEYSIRSDIEQEITGQQPDAIEWQEPDSQPPDAEQSAENLAAEYEYSTRKDIEQGTTGQQPDVTEQQEPDSQSPDAEEQKLNSQLHDAEQFAAHRTAEQSAAHLSTEQSGQASESAQQGQQHEQHHEDGHHGHHHKKNRNIAGKILAIAFLAVGGLFSGYLWNSGIAPTKYLIVSIIAVIVIFALLWFLAANKKKAGRITGIILSVIFILLFGVGAALISKTTQAIEEVSGSNYKLDEMVMAVRIDDPAENLLETAGYRMGVQTGLDQDNTALMMDKINETLGQEQKTVEYESMSELAEALIKGRVDAAVYNQALTGLISEDIEDYSDQIKIIYTYGIETPILQEEVEAEPEESFNMYLSGIDVEGDISTTSRSDVNIIMTVNPTTHTILLTTTPRDYFVTFPGITGEERDKLTHAGIYGVDVSMATLGNLYGIDIPYYARINFTGFETVVDALGGIDVYSEYAFDTVLHSYQQGYNHLDGAAALTFVRERHSFESGDNQRGKNQEAALTAIMEKLMSPAIIGSAFTILDEVSGFIQTNMTTEQIAGFINTQIDSGATWTIESQAVIGTGASSTTYSYPSTELYVMIPNEESVSEAAAKIQSVLGE